MATEFPDDPEVDLGFRDSATEKSVPEYAEQWKAPMELRVPSRPRISKPRPNDRWWSLRATIVIFLSALGGLISSIFLFEHAQRPNILSHWKHELYTAPRTTEALPTITNMDIRLDRIPAFQIGREIGDFAIPSEEPDQFTSLDRRRPLIDATLRIPPGAPSSAPFLDFSVGTASEVVAAENVSREDATQTKRTVRATTEKTRKRQIARFRRRAAKRVVRSAKSIASFWAFWSRHVFNSGLAGTSPNRRFATRKSIRRKSKASSWFPLSWHAARPVKHEISGKTELAAPRLQSAAYSNSNHPQSR